MAGAVGVYVPEPAVAALHPTVLLQSLEHKKTSQNKNSSAFTLNAVCAAFTSWKQKWASYKTSPLGINRNYHTALLLSYWLSRGVSESVSRKT